MKTHLLHTHTWLFIYKLKIHAWDNANNKLIFDHLSWFFTLLLFGMTEMAQMDVLKVNDNVLIFSIFVQIWI